MSRLKAHTVVKFIGATIFAVLCLSALLFSPTASAVSMVNDPKGFQGIPWGTALADSPNVTLVESTDRIKQFDLKQSPPRLGEATVESLRLVSIDGKFARVIIRYQGMKTHQLVLQHLQSQFGPLDLTPGQIARGILQQFTWFGPESEITLTYDVKRDLGLIFLESRALASKFQEGMAPDPDLAGATY